MRVRELVLERLPRPPFPECYLSTRGATAIAAIAMTAANANTAGKDSPAPANAANTMPVVARASAPPIESEMDIAELLNP